jgi:small-conductance mechanosensitive channel
MQNTTAQYIDQIFRALNYEIFALGEAKITPLTIFYLVVLTFLVVYLSGKLKDLLVTKLLGKTRLDTGAKLAIGTISRYLMLFIGFLIVLQTVGINLTTLNVVAGAIGIGVGFGLQNIANNFISGLIILTERPIKVGDRIEVDKVSGKVIKIGARSTTVLTNDNISIIVPNSKFIAENVVNWSFASNLIRFKMPIRVPYDADVDLVSKLMLEVASENDDVLKDPPPSARLMQFGENALHFELRAWSKTQLHHPGAFKSTLNLAMVRRLSEHGIKLDTSPAWPVPPGDGGQNYFDPHVSEMPDLKQNSMSS